jgi:hypothetical protein
MMRTMQGMGLMNQKIVILILMSRVILRKVVILVRRRVVMVRNVVMRVAMKRQPNKIPLMLVG